MKRDRFTKKMQCSGESMRLGLAWYRPEQWDRLLAVSEDRADLERTHKEWLIGILDLCRQLEQEGVAFERVDVEVEELAAWCRARKAPINSDSRSEYVVDKLRSRERKPGEGGLAS